MILQIDLGEAPVLTSKGEEDLIPICIIWIDPTEWNETPFDLQKQAYAFADRRYKDRHIFYCSDFAGVFEIEHISPSEEAVLKASEDTLKKIFLKNIAALIKSGKLQREEVSVPRLK